jgi:UTP--glucose-1-phosphate uridylyltransferase
MPPMVDLDREFYRGLQDFEQRIPIPVSLVDCSSLRIEGDVRLGREVTFRGDVTLRSRAAEAVKVGDRRTFTEGTHDL